MRLVEATVQVTTQRKLKQECPRGETVKLIEYPTKKEFLKKCKALHCDETDPEIRFLHWKNIPTGYVTTNYIAEMLFPIIQELKMLNTGQRYAFTLWMENNPDAVFVLSTPSLMNLFWEQYKGNYSNELDFAYAHAEEELNIIPTKHPHFDFCSYRNFLFKDMYVIVYGHVFLKEALPFLEAPTIHMAASGS